MTFFSEWIKSIYSLNKKSNIFYCDQQTLSKYCTFTKPTGPCEVFQFGFGQDEWCTSIWTIWHHSFSSDLPTVNQVQQQQHLSPFFKGGFHWLCCIDKNRPVIVTKRFWFIFMLFSFLHLWSHFKKGQTELCDRGCVKLHP